jgi:hypothetical protein
MIIRPLVRLEQEPAFRTFAPDDTHRGAKVVGDITSDAEEYGTRRVRCDDRLSVLVVEVVERRREGTIHVDDR